LGNIPPNRFIPLAEETGLIGTLGHWALKEACKQMNQWREAGIEVPTVAVNMSPINFQNLHLPGLIADVLSYSALIPSSLTLELTKRTVLDTTG